MKNWNFGSITITILGILFILLGLFALFLMPPLSFISSFLAIGGGIGLFLRKNWGRYTIIIVASTSLFGLVTDTLYWIRLLNKELPSKQIIIQDVLGWFMLPGIIYFLTRPKVKGQFK